MQTQIDDPSDTPNPIFPGSPDSQQWIIFGCIRFGQPTFRIIFVRRLNGSAGMTSPDKPPNTDVTGLATDTHRSYAKCNTISKTGNWHTSQLYMQNCTAIN